MKQLGIKIGKVRSLIKQEGFSGATKSMSKMLGSSISTVGSGQILYISGGYGGSARYRAAHIVEELNARGFIAEMTVADNPFLARYIDRFDIFVLRRVTYNQKIENFISKAKKKGKVVIFETDDLVFNEKMFTQTDAFRKMNNLEKSQYESGRSSAIADHPDVVYATASTVPLARHLEKRGKKVFVVKNKLSEEFLRIADDISSEKDRRGKNFRIGYFSGTASHDRDFAVAAPGLLKIMEEDKTIELLLVGPLHISKDFEKFGDRVIKRSFASIDEHFKNIASCHLNISPLEIGDDFCESKSAIKYYEAGLVQTPTLASATEVFRDAIDDGVNGYLAESGDDWYRKIKDAITDEEGLLRVANRAYDDVIKYHTTRSQGNVDYYRFLRQQIDRSESENLIPLENPRPGDICIVILNWNGKELTKGCLESLRKQTDQRFKVIVVDNGSDDGSREMIDGDFPEVATIYMAKNEGFAHSTNAGIRAALSYPEIDSIITVNNDAQCDPRYIETLQDARDGLCEKIGALQPKVLNYYEKENLDATGVITCFEMSALNRGIGEKDRGQYDDKKEIFGPSASAALYTRKALEDTMLPHAGYFDKDYFAYYEDVDLAWRLHSAGYSVAFVPKAKVYHVHSATGGNNSAFKAFHIHRNHFYNMIKNAPIYYLPILLLIITPLRYILTICSMLAGSGASARLKENQAKKSGGQKSILQILIESWVDVVKSAPKLIRKRRFIMKKKRRSSLAFFGVIKNHYAKLFTIIFK